MENISDLGCQYIVSEDEDGEVVCGEVAHDLCPNCKTYHCSSHFHECDIHE